MKPNERIRELRTALDLSVRQFAKQLGYNNSTLSTVENGHSAVTDRLIKSICAKFNVNETWLRTGKGEMFVTEEPKQSREEVITQFIQTILEELSEANRRIVLDAIENLRQEKFFKQGKQ